MSDDRHVWNKRKQNCFSGKKEDTPLGVIDMESGYKSLYVNLAHIVAPLPIDFSTVVEILIGLTLVRDENTGPST